jgi:AsmA protein
LKRLAIILAVAIAVVAIVLAAAPFVIPSDFLRQRVAERIAALTGRSVTVSGPAALSVYPYVGISVGDVAVANPEGMGDDPTLTSKRLDTRLRLWPLLLGRVEFDEFVLSNPTLHLVVDADGRANWSLAGSPVAAPKKDASGQPFPDDVAIGHLVVNNGTVLYDNRHLNTREEMHDVDLDIDWPSLAATASGRGNLTWRGEPVEFTALVAAPVQLLSGGGASAARFAIASTPLRVSFSGRATYREKLHLDGDSSISTPSMRRTIEWLGPPMGTGAILGAASVRGTVAITPHSVDFSSAELELDGNSAEGSLGVAFSAAKPLISGKLNAQRLDLSAYMEAVRADVFSNGSWLIAPAQLPFAEAVDTDLSFSTADMLAGATEIRDTWSTVKIRDGALDMALQGANLYGGQIGAHLTATPSGTLLATQLHLDAKDVPANPALSSLAGITAVEGTLTGSMDLAATGRGWGEVANSVAGSGSFTITDGRVTGINLPEVADVLSDPTAGPVVASGGETDFHEATASFAVAGLDLSSRDLFMEGDEFHLSLSGKGSLASGAIDARATLTNTTETIPVSFAGTWRQPAIARISLRNAPAEPENEH